MQCPVNGVTQIRTSRVGSRGTRVISMVVGAAGLFAVPTLAHAQYVGHVSSFVMDARTGTVLSESDPDLQRYPASLTKLMTLYLAFKSLKANRVSLDTPVPVSIHASKMEPSKLGLVPGTRFSVEQAILALVTKSANDAACALGELLGGGDEVRFANFMTAQARAMGMSNTTFRNASGLPDPEQVTTARDLAVLTRRLIADFPEYYHYFNVPAFYFHHRLIPNHDPMLKTYEGADGLKTGYTHLAGHNLVTSAERGGVRLIGVVLGARSNPRRSRMMTALMDNGFEAEGVARAAPLMVATTHYHHRHGHAYVVGVHAHTAGGAPMEVAEAASSRLYKPVHHHHVTKTVHHTVHHHAATTHHHTPHHHVKAKVRLVSTSKSSHHTTSKHTHKTTTHKHSSTKHHHG